MGTLSVYGNFTDISTSLTFSCPPDNYNGFSYNYSYCKTEDYYTLMGFYVGEDDGLLYAIDVILSGAPFPSTLTANEPPFGVARFNFSEGLTI